MPSKVRCSPRGPGVALHHPPALYLPINRHGTGHRLYPAAPFERTTVSPTHRGDCLQMTVPPFLMMIARFDIAVSNA